MSPDLINGIFESMGGFFIALSCVKLYRDKKVRGISFGHAMFFTCWGYWNLFYYPGLDQWFSFYGGLFVVAVNTVWLGQMFYYNQIERLRPRSLTISAKGLGTFPEPPRTERYRWSDK